MFAPLTLLTIPSNHLQITAAQRLALAAAGGGVELPSKRQKLKATKMPKKRAAYPSLP
jgi:hypothetical protein